MVKSCNTYPSDFTQDENFNKCLNRERKTVCVMTDPAVANADFDGLDISGKYEGGLGVNVADCLRMQEMYDGGFYPSNHPSYASVAAEGGAISAETIRKFRETFLIYEEPDLVKCLKIPYFCDDKVWDYMTWR